MDNFELNNEWVENTPVDSVVPTFIGQEDEVLKQARLAWLAGETERETAAVKQTRLSQYRDIADPLFFKWQAGEATEQEWLDARKQVVIENPYPATN